MRVTEPRLIETIALGLVQGPAELLPISSSAHVGLLPWALGWQHAALPGAVRKEVEVAFHAGTALALGRPRAPLGVLATTTGARRPCLRARRRVAARDPSLDRARPACRIGRDGARRPRAGAADG